MCTFIDEILKMKFTLPKISYPVEYSSKEFMDLSDEFKLIRDEFINRFDIECRHSLMKPPGDIWSYPFTHNYVCAEALKKNQNSEIPALIQESFSKYLKQHGVLKEESMLSYSSLIKVIYECNSKWYHKYSFRSYVSIVLGCDKDLIKIESLKLRIRWLTEIIDDLDAKIGNC